MPTKSLATIYTFRKERCQVCKNGDTQILDVCIRWVEPGMPSPEQRHKVCQEMIARYGLKLKSETLQLELNGVVPRELAEETEARLSPPMPAARAKVVLQRVVSTREEREQCYAFEAMVESKLEGSEVGFMDGNEISATDHQIYLHGPRKQPLMDLAQDLIEGQDGWEIMGRKSARAK